VTEDLVPNIRAIDADLQTQASDHQPLLLTLDDRKASAANG
jgi:hypothetical protein